MQKYTKKISFLFVIIALVLPITAQASDIQIADSATSRALNKLGTVGEKTGLGTLSMSDDPNIGLYDKIAAIINIALGFVGIIAVILIIYAGFKWITAGGNEEQVKSSRDIIRNAVIGIGIVMLAYVITNFVTKSLIGVIQEGGPGNGGGSSQTLCEFEASSLTFCLPKTQAQCETLGGRYNASCEKQTYCTDYGENHDGACWIMTETRCRDLEGNLSDVSCRDQ